MQTQTVAFPIYSAIAATMYKQAMTQGTRKPRKAAGMTHEEFIHAVRLAASLSPALKDGERDKVLAVKLMYGIGERGLRGVTYYGKWNTLGHGAGTGKAGACPDCPPVDLAEVCAAGEESPVQIAGTTIHELGHVLAGWGSGHGKEWKLACERLGLRHVKAAGTRYLMANFQPRVREVIASMGTPSDGRPMFRDGSLATGTPGICTQGVGTRGGKSRGTGSGSRMLKVVCPQGQCNEVGGAYVARVSQLWLNEGAPLCPSHKVAMVRV
jgi:hypothetical protein